jgi:hypothetical protein
MNPSTAQLTVTSGALPSMKDGIPLQVKIVNVDINRPDFTFNPTDCEPLAVDAQLTSTEGLTSQQVYPFQDTNCAAPSPNPQLPASTAGATSTSAAGASLVKTTQKKTKTRKKRKKHKPETRTKRHTKARHRSRRHGRAKRKG